METLTPSQCPFSGAFSGTPGVDLFNAGLFGNSDPHPIWTEMRAHDPVSRQLTGDGRHYWSLTRYHDVARVLRDHQSFSSEHGTLMLLLGKGDPAGGYQMAVTDPPRHGELRAPLQAALTMSKVEVDRERLRAAILDLITPLGDGGPYDLAVQMTKMPMAVIGVLMDLPAADQPRLIELTTAAIAPEEPRLALSGGTEEILKATHRELFAYFQDLVRDRRRRPGADLITILAEMEQDGRRLTPGEIVSNCYSLLLGASVTIAQVPVAAIHDLAGTSVLDEWADAPDALFTGVEEAVRWSSPTSHFMRYTNNDVVIGERRIPAGEAVVVWLGSANRDETVFVDPFRFDPRRRPNKHIAFGVGPHYCIGHTVARVALRILFAELFSRFTDFAVAGPVQRLHSTFIAGWTSVPITARLRPVRRPAAS